jgi:hypothetical protein
MSRTRQLPRLNVVNVALALIAASLVYLGWTFIPVYWQAHKVDNALSEVKWEASRINLYEDDPRGEAMLERLRQAAYDLKIDDRFLEVYFSEDHTSVHMDYVVDVRHFFGKTTSLEFHRKQEIPQAKGQ